MKISEIKYIVFLVSRIFKDILVLVYKINVFYYMWCFEVNIKNIKWFVKIKCEGENVIKNIGLVF